MKKPLFQGGFLARRIVRKDFRTGRQKNLALKKAIEEARRTGRPTADVAYEFRLNRRELDRHLRNPTRINLK